MFWNGIYSDYLLGTIHLGSMLQFLFYGFLLVLEALAITCDASTTEHSSLVRWHVWWQNQGSPSLWGTEVKGDYSFSTIFIE